MATVAASGARLCEAHMACFPKRIPLVGKHGLHSSHTGHDQRTPQGALPAVPTTCSGRVTAADKFLQLQGRRRLSLMRVYVWTGTRTSTWLCSAL
jgi:hypothetical protein